MLKNLRINPTVMKLQKYRPFHCLNVAKIVTRSSRTFKSEKVKKAPMVITTGKLAFTALVILWSCVEISNSAYSIKLPPFLT